MSKAPFVIKPMSSASNEQLVSNMKTNMDSIETWVERCRPNNKRAVMISAGHGMEHFLKEYTKQENDVIFCIKHALPALKKAGIIPDFCVALDPREVKGISTHGHVRSDLYSEASDGTTFFIASMTHPSVVDFIRSTGKKIVGWHALTPEMSHLPDEYKKKVGEFVITGGTSSCTRAIELAFFLGFRSFYLVGYESSYDKEMPTSIKDEKGKQKYLKVSVGDDYFYTTGELLAQAQDLERMMANPKHPCQLEFYDCESNSLVCAIQNKIGNKTFFKNTYDDYVV